MHLVHLFGTDLPYLALGNQASDLAHPLSLKHQRLQSFLRCMEAESEYCCCIAQATAAPGLIY